MSDEPTLEDFIFRLQHDPDPEVRRNAAWLLGRQRDQRINEPLLAAIDDDNASVRVRVAEALGTIKDDQRVTPALIALLGDADTDVRARAARSLGFLADARALQPLQQLLTDAEVAVRAEVAEALGQGALRDESSIDALLRCLIEDADRNTRHYAAQSLVNIGTEPVVSALIAALKQYDDDAGILIDLIEVLGKIGDSAATDALAQLQQHTDEDVQTMANWALSVLG